MVDIDERVVQMKFDATDFDQNTKKTMSTLDKLREKLSFKDVVDNNAMNTIADNVQKVADKAYTIVDRVIDKIKDNIANKLVNFIQDNTIGQLNAGWNKYADMTTSVATLTGQGYGLKQINEQLERLMYFTDETSFKFTDMVGEIGKFTASGQSLENATTAMMGIAEWAALSGKNANEASRAMYQLSQALGAGQMRLVDWKSIQNLNMDTQEFRQNAIEAAIAVGTLKDNLDGTYTTLVGKKKGSLSFNIREFSDKLTEGAWFTTEVMMEVYSKYSEAVDDIRDVYEKGYFFNNDNEYVAINTTAEAVKEIKKSNNELIKRFANEDEEGLQLTSDQINSILLKWKQVAKVVNHVNDLDEEGNKIISDEEAAKVPEMYAEYLKEYSEIFQGTEEDARRALQDWEKYVAEFGMKAFEKSFEAKTFVEAIESAKDAASTVWVQIYQDIFGDYEQAKEIWTDLANTLYELFVNRLWNLQENIIGHWKTGGKSTLEKMVTEYEAEIMKLQNTANFGEEEAEQIRILQAEIDNLNDQIENGTFRDGRKIFMQGIYGFGSGLKSVIMNFRDGWDSLFTTGETGEKLLTWSEKLRVAGFKFYLMMNKLGESDFYVNLAKGVKNLFAPIAALKKIIHSVIQSFLPSGETFISILNKLAAGFANLTAKIVPSQETVVNIARVLRGIIAFIKLIAKAALGFYNATLKPIISVIYTAITETFGKILELFAEVGDRMYNLEEGLDIFEAMEVVGSAIKDTLEGIWYLIKTIFGLLWKVVGPVLGIIYRTVKSIVDEVKQMSSGTGGFFGGLAEKFKDVAKRAHDAWFSVNSFKDVFNTYSDQKGLPAFLMMIGDLLDTLITKIGATILAIFGLDEAVSTGKMSKGLQTLRDIIADIAIGLKWIYTNVIRPILGTLIEGLGASLHTLGEQWRSGDLKGFLGTIREIIGTFTSIGLFKFVGTINKVFGAGGLLRVFRNAAKTIKQIGNYFSAKTFNEISGGILKLAIAFIILVGAVTALTFLPAENMAKMNSIMISFAIALGIILIGIFAISKALKGTEISLWGFASAMFGIVAVVGIFILAVAKLHKALTGLFQIEEEYEYKDEAGNTKTGTRMREPTGKEFMARLLSLIAPIILIIGGIAATMAIIKALGGAATLMQFGLTVAGLGVGMFMLVNAIDDLIDIFSRNDTDLAAKITGATIYILGLMAILALISRLLTNPKMMGSQSMSKSVTGALVMCITIAGMALVVRGVLIPTLETLADSAYSFWDYVGALLIIAGGMFTIAGTLALMSKNTGNFLNKISSGVVFILFAKVLQTVIVPLIETFASMDLNGGIIVAIGAVAAVCFIISGAIQTIFLALAEIIKAVAGLQAKQLVPIIVSIGLVIGGIMWLGSYLKENGSMMNAEEVGLILAAVGGIILLIGLFAIMLNREFKGTDLKNFSKTLTTLTILVGVTGLAIAGLIFELKTMFKDDTRNAIITLLAVALTMILVVGGNLQAFASAVSDVSQAFAGLSNSQIKQVRNMFVILFGAIAGIMLVITVGMAVIAKAYENQTDNLVITFIFLILGTIALVTTAMYMMESVITNLAKAVAPLTGGKTGKIHQIEVILATTFIGIAAIMAVMALGAALIGGVTGGYTWESLFPMIGMVAGSILAFKFITESVEKLVSIIGDAKPQKLEYTKSILLMMLVTIVAMFVILGGATAGIAQALQGYTWESFVPAIAIALASVIAFSGIANAFNKLATTLNTLASFNLKNIIATMTTILVITGLMSTIMVALMNWMAGNGVGGEQNLMNAAAILVTVVLTFSALLGIINLAAPAANTFVAAAAKIAGGIFLIGAAVSVLAASIMMIKDAFGIGQNISEGVAEGIKDNSKSATDAATDMMTDVNKAGAKASKIASPSKVFAQDGKFIDQGLAQGIKKNTNLATSASKALAVATNESFKKELKIASPSKVFYENGKFVIRGFINGANSEMQKQKDLGAAMGEGFAESAKAEMEDAWKGLWDGQEMKDWIENFSKEGGLNFGEEAGKSLFSAFLGEETADENGLKKQLTADEQRAISLYEEKIREANWKIEGLTIHGKDLATYGASSEAIQANNHEIEMLKDEVEKYEKARDNVISKTTKKRTGGIFGGLEDVFDGLGEEFGNIMSSSMLGSIGEWFGEGGEGLDKITQTFDTALGTAGDTGASMFISRLFGGLGLDENGKDTKGNFTSIGDQIGGGIATGIKNGLADLFLHNKAARGLGWIAYKIGIMDAKTYEDIFGEGPNDETAIITNYQNKVNEKTNPLIDYSSDRTSGRAMIKQYLANEYISRNWEHFVGMSDKSFANFFDQFTAKINPILDKYEQSDDFHGYLDQNKELKLNLGDISWDEKKDVYKELRNLLSFNNFWYNDMTYQERKELNEKEENLKKKAKEFYNNNKDNLDEYSENYPRFYRDQLSEVFAVSPLILKTLYESESYGFTGIDTKILSEEHGNVLAEFNKMAKKYKLGGQEMIKFLYYGMMNGYLDYDYENKLFRVIDENAYQQLKEWFKQFEINSPSKATERMMRYFVDGMPIGIEEELPEVLGSIDDATDLITDETIAGLNGMQYMLDNDITPTVTPVFDSSTLTNGVDTINSALDSVQPRVDSVIGSFGIESTDYTGNLNALGNRIEGTNSLVNTLIGMLESGAGVNIHVEAEADPTNIYQLVVDTNRTEWKRTGINNLAY